MARQHRSDDDDRGEIDMLGHLMGFEPAVGEPQAPTLGWHRHWAGLPSVCIRCQPTRPTGTEWSSVNRYQVSADDLCYLCKRTLRTCDE